MLKILCPTDFSDHAKLAMQHAVTIGNLLDAEMHFITSFVDRRATGAMVSMKRAIRENHEREMKYLTAGLQQFITTDHSPKYEVLEGSTVTSIKKYIDKHSIDLVVMGTQGSNSIENVLFGSTTIKLLSQLDVPVLAVPAGILYGPGEPKYVLAVDNQIVESNPAFDIIKKLCKPTNRKVEILHIEKDQEDIPFDPFISAYLEEAMGEIVLIKGDDPLHEIHKYTKENNVEMLIMIKRAHGLLQKLFVKDHTSQEIAKATIPLLIIPE